MMYARHKNTGSNLSSGTVTHDHSQPTDDGTDKEGTNKQATALDKTEIPSANKDFKSAVVIIPPEELWPQIQKIRQEHDKSYVRWMPHINLMFPFIEDTGDNFQDAVEKIKKCLQGIKSFKILFNKDSFGYFNHKKEYPLWIKPLEEIPQIDSKPNVTGSSNTDIPTSVKSADNLNETITNPSDNVNEIVKISSNDDKTEENVLKNVVSTADSSATSKHDVLENVADNPVQDLGDLMEVLETSDHEETSKPVGGTKSKKRPSKQKRSQQYKEVKMTKSKTSMESSEYRFHPGVIALQSQLESVFPDCTDISQISRSGFAPHLTLGQFRHSNVNQYMANFKEDWQDLTFELTDICLISRADFDDPFHVRYRIKLGEI